MNTLAPVSRVLGDEQPLTSTSVVEGAPSGLFQDVTPNPWSRGVIRGHKRNTPAPKISLSDLFQPNTTLAKASTAGSATVRKRPENETDETKDDHNVASSSMDEREVGLASTIFRNMDFPATYFPFKSKSERTVLTSSSGSVDEISSINSRSNTKLKLKVPRGALAKARRKARGTSQASASSDGSASELGADRKCRTLTTKGHNTENISARNDTTKTADAAAELETYKGVKATGVKPFTEDCVLQQQQQQLHARGRFRCWVSDWVRRARHAVGRGGTGAGTGTGLRR